jgi:hypothetical protein
MVRMAGAFAQAVRAGRSALLGGPMAVQEIAVSSTPEIGRLFALDSSSSAALATESASPLRPSDCRETFQGSNNGATS